jgi:hypothetical protein
MAPVLQERCQRIDRLPDPLDAADILDKHLGGQEAVQVEAQAIAPGPTALRAHLRPQRADHLRRDRQADGLEGGDHLRAHGAAVGLEQVADDLRLGTTGQLLRVGHRLLPVKCAPFLVRQTWHCGVATK